MCMRLTYLLVVMMLLAVGFDFQFGFAPLVVLLANLIVATALFWCHNWRRKCNEAESRQFEQSTETFVQSQLNDGTCTNELMSIFHLHGPRRQVFDFSQPTIELSGQENNASVCDFNQPTTESSGPDGKASGHQDESLNTDLGHTPYLVDHISRNTNNYKREI